VVTTLAHLEQGRGAARLLEGSADRVVVEVEGAGGIVALRRAFQPLLVATDETGRTLTTVPVHAALLGVVVPEGRHRVVVAVDDRPTVAAGVTALLAALGALGVALAARRRSVS